MFYNIVCRKNEKKHLIFGLQSFFQPLLSLSHTIGLCSKFSKRKVTGWWLPDTSRSCISSSVPDIRWSVTCSRPPGSHRKFPDSPTNPDKREPGLQRWVRSRLLRLRDCSEIRTRLNQKSVKNNSFKTLFHKSEDTNKI